MNYGDLLERSWKYLWRHKVLWLFGILQGCQTFNFNTGNDVSQQQALARLERWVADPIVLMALVIFGLSIALLFFILSTVGTIGLIRLTALADQNVPKIRFEDVFSDLWSTFWRLFGVNLLWGILIMGLVTIWVGIPVVVTLLVIPDALFGIGLLVVEILFLLLCLFLPLVFALIPFLEMTMTTLVVEKVGILKGIRQAWYIYRHHFGKLLVLLLIVTAIRIFVPLPILVPLAALPATPWIILVLLPPGLLFFGILNAFSQNVFTLAYLQLRPEPKRELGGFPSSPLSFWDVSQV